MWHFKVSGRSRAMDNKIYVLNDMTGFRAIVDADGITIEENKNLSMALNTKYIALLIKLTSRYSDINKLYKALCHELKFSYTCVIWGY